MEYTVLTLLLNSVLPAICLAGAGLYALYFACDRDAWWIGSTSLIFLLGTVHQVAEVRTWWRVGRVPAPDWVLGDSVETAVYLLSVIFFVLLAVYLDRNRELMRQKDLLMSEMEHRVKNNLQTIRSLLSVREKELEDEEARRALRTLSDKIQSFAILHKKLHAVNAVQQVDVRDYMTELAESVMAYEPDDKNIELRVDVEPVNLPVDTVLACGLMVAELLGNALQHAFDGRKDGRVDVSFSEGETCRLRVSDDGRGIPSGVLTRETGGLDIVRSVVNHELDGDLEITRNGGTTVTVSFLK